MDSATTAAFPLRQVMAGDTQRTAVAASRFRQAWACSVVALLALPVEAQEAARDLEQIIVTGSRIARPDFESASPIVSIAADAFQRTSASSVESVVSRLPQFTPDATSTSNNPGNGGQGNVQLRGLGPTSTLVLLDGRRLVPANGDSVVDVNVIPSALVESVEVISGGASAVYGSDAIAGVVNFKLKDKFEGIQFDGGWAETERGDGTEYTAGVTGGLSFADGRGEAYGYLGYSEREAVFQRARRFSEVVLSYEGPGSGEVGPDGGFQPSGSPIIPEGRAGFPSNRPTQAAIDALFAGYGYAAGTVRLPPNNLSFNADGSVFSTGDGNPGSVANFRGEQDPILYNDRNYTYNYGPWNYLQLPLERTSAFARASFEISSAAELYGQALYSDYTADQTLAPTVAQPLLVPRSNPYIPADFGFLLDSRPDPTAPMRMNKRLVELGPRIASNQHDVLQVTVGSSGRVFGAWNYDAYVQTGRYESTESQSGNALRSKIMELTFAPDGGVSVCGGLDLFGPESISEGCAEYIAVGGTNRSHYDQTVAEASMSGTAFALPAGDVKVAVGVLYKRDEYVYEADPIGSIFLDDGAADIVGFNASDDVDGSDHNVDVFVEAVVPLVSGVTGVERLETVLGYRHSEYESAGGVDSYKAEFLYDPVKSLTLRGSYQHAVRAPSVFELYQPQLPSFTFDERDDGSPLDPCEANSPERSGPDVAQVEALCLAQGVPAALLPDFVDSDGLHYGVGGGNPDLGPETADTWTAGFVLRPGSVHPLLASMQLSVDWYNIDMEDAIVATYATDYVPWCFDARVNPAFDASNEQCRQFSRDPTSGEIVDLQDINRNIVGYDVSGIDTQFDWSFAAGSGTVGVNWLVSWMDSFENVPVQGLPPQDDVGYVGGFLGGSLPEWKWNLNLNYAWGGLTVAAQWRYVDSMSDRNWDYSISSQDYFDLFAGYEFGPGMFDGLTLRGGVENLTDADPPLIPTQVAANTDPSQYDVMGRRYYVSLSYRF
jgi:outer membrane receptor protein involved in Fe transport